MYNNTEKRLVAIRNELRAQKASNKIVSGALITPPEIPEATWSGKVDITQIQNPPTFLAAFTRTDGVDAPPLVDFAVKAEFSPTPNEIAKTYGAQFSVSSSDDLNSIWTTEAEYQLAVNQDNNQTSAIISIPTTGFFETWMTGGVAQNYKYPTPTLSLVVQAISLADGTLKLEEVS